MDENGWTNWENQLNRMTSVFCGGFFACAMTFFAGYLIGGRKI